MKKLLISLFLIAGLASQAQNLVFNPSFEIFSQCPDTFSQITFATGWSSFRINPDYYNACDSTDYCCSVPITIQGYQPAASGNAYAGFYAYHKSATNLREYIGGQLSSPLAVGTEYYVSFKINLPDKRSYAVNKIGALFTMNSYSEAAPLPITNFSHVYAASVITDTANWITVSGSFIADSGYQFIALGNFFNDANTDTVKVGNDAGDIAYYFIDDVYVSTDSVNAVLLNSPFENPINIIYNSEGNIEITLSEKDYKRAKLSIFNLSGQLIISEYSIGSIITINTQSFSSGIYIVNIETNNHSINKKIFIGK